MVVHYPRTVWKNSYAEHEETGKTYQKKERKKGRGQNSLSVVTNLLHRVIEPSEKISFTVDDRYSGFIKNGLGGLSILCLYIAE